MGRVKVQIGGRWVKSISFAPGAGLKVQRVHWTVQPHEAIALAPIVADQVKRMYNPAVVAQMKAREAAAMAAAGELFAQAMDAVSLEMGKDVRAILKPIL